MTIPTEGNIEYGLKKIFHAGLKKEKVGIVEQVALFPILAFAENKAIGELKKARQLGIYQFMIDNQDHLTDKQKEEKVKACEERLQQG
jgi:ABC-type Fe3+/spermidine/putrescine transport system ATPase subunit